MRRILPVILLSVLVAGCSGDRKTPPPAISPTGNASPSPARMDNGSTADARAGQGAGAVTGNSPPEIRSVRFVPVNTQGGAGLAVEAEGYDPDGEPVQFEITWKKNGNPAGQGDRLEGPLKRGDRITMAITPFDGKARGRTAELSREVRNSPPVIKGQEEFRVSGNLVTFSVRAYDPDGDPIHYSLKDAPAGMSIDRSNGHVRWESPAGTTGKVPFTVVASDDFGGEGTARITVTIAVEPVSAAAPR